MPPNPQKFITDVFRAIEELKHFTVDKSLTDLENDRGLQLIIEREFEIIGEALYRLRHHSPDLFEAISNGHRIIGLRNLLAHGYNIVEHVILWDALQKDLPILLQELARLR